ncbi:uncharacterized protein J3R85_012173 [Psidium guajava]|nr:uncharacterized protein J3R85_012173 [Psidium guajava]
MTPLLRGQVAATFSAKPEELLGCNTMGGGNRRHGKASLVLVSGRSRFVPYNRSIHRRGSSRGHRSSCATCWLAAVSSHGGQHQKMREIARTCN